MIGRKKTEQSPTNSSSAEDNAGDGMDDMGMPPSKTTASDGSDETAALEIEHDEAINKYQRVLADFRNFQRRSVQNEISAAERAKQDLIRELIPVLDNFNLVIEHAGEGAEESGEAVEATLKGVGMVHAILVQTLAQKGLVKVEPGRGELFDPNYHEAMMMETTDEVKPNHIVKCVQAGYRMGETMLRPAKVIIATGSAGDNPLTTADDSYEDDNDITEA